MKEIRSRSCSFFSHRKCDLRSSVTWQQLWSRSARILQTPEPGTNAKQIGNRPVTLSNMAMAFITIGVIKLNLA